MPKWNKGHEMTGNYVRYPLEQINYRSKNSKIITCSWHSSKNGTTKF